MPDLPDILRIATVQFRQNAVGSFTELAKRVSYFVEAAAGYGADFALFPEWFTLPLLARDASPLPAGEAMAELSRHTHPLRALLSELAVRCHVNIIGGSHPVQEADGRILNVCHVCLRDGSVHARSKIHPTPNERAVWNIAGGDTALIIPTDRGPIGVMICYDSEFPELARHLTEQGAQILFVPFSTDDRQGYLRVRYCAQARAVENQVYVAMAGNVGNLTGVENADTHYAQSCILTPCDFPFARDGIAAEAAPDVETLCIADLSLARLRQARAAGTVQNLKDRRADLYAVEWRNR